MIALSAMRRTINVRRWAFAAALALLTILLVRNLGQMLQFAALALGYPYEFDYGEGIVWQQMRNIVGGSGYGPLGVYPAIVYHYPPVYHLLTAGVAALGGLDQLVAGRLVSVLSTVAMAIFAGLLTADAVPRAERPAVRALCGVVGGLCLVSCYPTMIWSALMRVDMLAGAFTLAGLLFAIRAPERPSAILFAGTAFVLAIYTKHSSVAAPAAAFAGLWLVRPQAALVLLGTCLALGLAALAWLSWTTDGGFLRHVLFYNFNRLDLSQVKQLGRILPWHAAFIAVAGISAGACWRRLRSAEKPAKDRSLVALPILLLFLILKTLMLMMILKSGSSSNYLIEWFCAVAIFVGIGIAPAARIALGGAGRLPVLLGALILVALPLQARKVPGWNVTREQAEQRMAQLSPLVDRIRRSGKPVISDDMVLIIRAGKPVRWEPAIATELAHSGLYDEAAFVGMVRRQEFGFFITRASRGDRLFDDRYNPVVADAMDAAYPRKESVAGLVLHLPR